MINLLIVGKKSLMVHFIFIFPISGELVSRPVVVRAVHLFCYKERRKEGKKERKRDGKKDKEACPITAPL